MQKREEIGNLVRSFAAVGYTLSVRSLEDGSGARVEAEVATGTVSVTRSDPKMPSLLGWLDGYLSGVLAEQKRAARL